MDKVEKIIRSVLEQSGFKYDVDTEEDSRKVLVEVLTEKRKLKLCFWDSDDEMEISMRMYNVVRCDNPQRAYPCLNDLNRSYNHFKCVYNEITRSIDIHAEFRIAEEVISSENVEWAIYMISALESLLEQLELMVEEHDEKQLLEMIRKGWHTMILKKIKEDYQISDASMRTFLSSVEVKEIKNGVLRLKYPNEICIPFLTRNFAAPIRNTISRVFRSYLEVEFYSNN